MRFDITKIPVGGMLIGFLLAATIVTFIGAFAATDDDGGNGEQVQASPTATPAASPTPAGSPTATPSGSPTPAGSPTATPSGSPTPGGSPPPPPPPTAPPSGSPTPGGPPPATPAGSATPGGSPTPTVPPVLSAFVIKMLAPTKFDVNEMRLPANKEVTVRVDNQESGVFHSWSAYTDDSATEKIAGTELCTGPCIKEVRFTTPDAGEYFFRCDVHTQVMFGKLVVE